MAKEFPFDTCTNYIICVDRYRVTAVLASQSLYGALGRSKQGAMDSEGVIIIIENYFSILYKNWFKFNIIVKKHKIKMFLIVI